ncbi:MAG TPA: Phenylacetic acid catabolic protein [Ktedonobacterales bacterium]|nr:Phenylacetic acid catabolic protein [Ktedonobacterales bacterium]
MSPVAIDNGALFAVLSSLADNKQLLGRRYAHWSNGAPSLEAAVAAAAMTQDELGHARTLYPLLEQFAQGQSDPTQLDPMTRDARYAVATLDHEFLGWADFIAASFLTDTALTTFFAAAQDSSYEPLRARARKIIQEERVHFTHAAGWVARLANAGGAVRANLVAALDRWWDETLCWFGPDDDPTMRRLYDDGVIDATPDTLRSRYLAIIMPALSRAGLDEPATHDDATDTWRPTEPLPWTRWDAATRRLGGI